MDKWTYRYYVTQNLMILGVSIEALTLYPSHMWVFLVAVPVAVGVLLHLFTLVMRVEDKC
jgi:hypothetical protein